ncbi:MAG: hypothetical protein ACPG49_04770, partial [Chitinophagales bacterium]
SIFMMTACVTDGTEDSNGNTESTGNRTAIKAEKKTNTENPLSIAEINRNLYLKNQFGKTETMDLKENDPLNRMGLEGAFRYNYFARTAAGDDNSRFFLAVYKYQSVEIADKVMEGRVKEIEEVKTLWNLNDFYIPVGEYILWIHSNCNINKDDWNGVIESVTSTLSAEPKSIDCQCSTRCKYE